MLIFFFHSIFINYLPGKKQVKNSCYLNYFVISILTTPKHVGILVQVGMYEFSNTLSVRLNHISLVIKIKVR